MKGVSDPKERQIYQSKYSNSWALVIGINKYAHTSPLNYATNDAKVIASTLIDRFAFPKENVSLLLNEAATHTAIKTSFLSFADTKKIQPNDRIIVYFAGHGLTLAGKRGEVGFLVPSDGNPDNVATLMRWDEFTRNADLVPAKHIFFLMDACYGGLMLQRAPSFGSMRFLGDMLKRYARQVLTAGKADQTVADGSGVRPGHSIFTAHLLDALEGKASTKEGLLSANGVMAYVYEQVGKDHYSTQTPHFGFLEGDGDFIFDTVILDKLRAEEPAPREDEPGKEKGEKGEADILVNTSQQVVTIPEPQEEKSVAETTKELLSDPTAKIKLDDYVTLHVRRLLEAIDLRNFPVQAVTIDQSSFLDRLGKYEEAVKDLQQIVILLAKWGSGDQLSLLEKIFIRIAETDKGSSGLVAWINLQWYPIQILMYSAGIAALSMKNFAALRISLETRVRWDDGRPGTFPLAMAVSARMGDLHDIFKWLPGLEQKYVPRSEHLFALLQPVLEDLLSLGRSYESLFDRFEIFNALAYADAQNSGWGPYGRFGWKHSRGYGESPFDLLLEEAKREEKEWGPIKAGMFKGSFERFNEIVTPFKAKLDKIPWW